MNSSRVKDSENIGSLTEFVSGEIYIGNASGTLYLGVGDRRLMRLERTTYGDSGTIVHNADLISYSLYTGKVTIWND